MDKKCLNKLALGCAVCGLAAAAQANFPWEEVADEISLTSGIFQSAEIAYLGQSFNGGETLTLKLYAMDGAPTSGSFGFNTPGTLLFEETVPIGASLSGLATFSDASGSIVLPSTIAVSLSFGGIDNGELAGPLLFDPPTVGDSFNDFWALGYPNAGDPWSLFVIDDPDNPGGLLPVNFGIRITGDSGVLYDNLVNPLGLALAVPEPGTWVSMGGLALLAASVVVRRYRRAA
jgi:hypothetical protein